MITLLCDNVFAAVVSGPTNNLLLNIYADCVLSAGADSKE